MRILRPLVVALLTAALAAHVAYWYLPRERGAMIDSASPAGELFLEGRQSVRVWFAYPHQNLGAAGEAMEDPEAALAAAARLAGLGELALPAFGPFAVPPARALAIAVEPGGERLAVAIEVFPAVALVARIAGLVADNPILRGGAATVSGRAVRVAWRGSSWTLAGDDVAPPSSSAAAQPAAPVEEGLAFLAIATRQGSIEPGVYRLRHVGGDLVLSSAGSGDRPDWSDVVERRAREHDLAFLALRARSPEAISLLLMPRMLKRGLRLPDSAVAWTASDQRWPLPGERILRVLGIEPEKAEVGAWRIAAMETESLELAARLAPEIGEVAAEHGASLLLWVRPLEYLPLVKTIAAALGALPIAPRQEVERWRDLEELLESIGPVDRIVVAVAAGGSEARLGWAPP